jgi:hypothetical protein
MSQRTVLCLWPLAVACATLACRAPEASAPHRDRRPGAVILERTPNGGLQPQAVVDDRGILHLMYFSGAADRGDVFYVSRHPGTEKFSAPIRVNDQAGSATAVGIVRGAQFTIGRNRRVHVVWNGSAVAEPRGPGGTPMLYSRLNDERSVFEPQRNLITWAGGIDGGGAVAADHRGTVYVFWHAGSDESSRVVYLARSRDDGASFERERLVSPRDAGACGCCGMRAGAGGSGLFVLYRAARGGVDRETMLLVSCDPGDSFGATRLHPWRVNVCPMSTSVLIVSDGTVWGAWQTDQDVYMDQLRPGRSPQPVSPGGSAARAHPVLARKRTGEILLAWIEGAGWQRGGSVAWQVYDSSGHLTPERRTLSGLAVWGSLAAVVDGEDSFHLFY